jgi:purine-binding chemotaxis protein CheW
MTDISTQNERRELLLRLARVGAQRIGLPATSAYDVSDWREPVPLPNAPPAVLGVVCLRGRMLTVLDALLLLGLSRTHETPPPRFIIPLHGDEQLALAVDEAQGSLEIFTDEIQMPDDNAGASLVYGILQREGEQINVLDTKELFAAAMHGQERRRQRF